MFEITEERRAHPILPLPLHRPGEGVKADAAAEGAQWTDGDFNGDGKVNEIDASILAANWGTSVVVENTPVTTPVETEARSAWPPVVGPRRVGVTTLVPVPAREEGTLARPVQEGKAVATEVSSVSIEVPVPARIMGPMLGPGQEGEEDVSVHSVRLRALAHDAALAETFAQAADSGVEGRGRMGLFDDPILDPEAMAYAR